MKNSESKQLFRSSFLIIILYLLCSLFSGLIFSIITIRAKKQNKLIVGWFLLSIISIVLFGYLGLALFKTSSPLIDPFYYYLGILTLVLNSIAVLVLFFALIEK
jgi:hypothetical protein